MKKYLAKSKLKSVYVENGKATKVFAKTYNKSDVLYEALNNSLMQCNDDAEQKAVVEIIKTMISDN